MARALLPVGVQSIRPVTFQIEGGVLVSLICRVEFVSGLVQDIDIFSQLTVAEKSQAQTMFNSISQAINSIFV